MAKIMAVMILLVCLGSLGAFGQADVQQNGCVPIYRITVVGRTVKAVNYRHRSGATKIDFRGTSLMPEARPRSPASRVRSRSTLSSRASRRRPSSAQSI